jgi:hypothetical protein
MPGTGQEWKRSKKEPQSGDPRERYHAQQLSSMQCVPSVKSSKERLSYQDYAKRQFSCIIMVFRKGQRTQQNRGET